MEDKTKLELIEKYLSGNASQEEIQIISSWYTSGFDEDFSWELDGEREDDVKERIHESIMMNITRPSKIRYYSNWKYYVSAAAVVLVVLFTNFFLSKNNKDKIVVNAPISQLENRHVLLPDSSIVILRPGGQLVVADDFNEEYRNVTLIGEAYFDIKPNQRKPFIIATGKIKTTVLGTAFSIKKHDGANHVEILVDHGQVKVENENKLVSVLEADQKLVVPQDEGHTKEFKNIKSQTKKELAWKEEDMRFEAMAFGDLIKKLERRYNVQIKFKNSVISLCKMSGVFQGTEVLDEVLTNLCLTSNTTFKKIEPNVFEIDGDSCFN